MKIVNETGKVVDVAIPTTGRMKMTVADGMASRIIEGLYSKPLDTCFQENDANARDALLMAGKGGTPYNLHIPTLLEPWLSFKDDGIGMSYDDCMFYCGGVGASSKRDDNLNRGGHGLGMKTAFLVSDQYLVISRFDGQQMTFTALKDETGEYHFLSLNTQSTSECNGLEIRIPYTGSDSRLMEVIIERSRFTNPKPITNIPVTWDDPQSKVQLEGEGWQLLTKGGYYASNKSEVIMGGVPYPLSESEVRVEWGDSYAKIVGHGVRLFLEIGDVPVPMNRESITYTDKAKYLLRSKLDDIGESMLTKAQADIDGEVSLWDKMAAYRISRSTLNSLTKNGDDLRIVWEGEESDDTQRIYLSTPSSMGVMEGDRLDLKNLTMTKYMGKAAAGIFVNTSPDQEHVAFMIEVKERKVPSRLLSYGQEHGYNRYKQVHIFYYPEGGLTLLKDELTYLLGTDWTLIDFKDVPDVAIKVRDRGKKVAGLKSLNAPSYSWNSADRDYWKDEGTLDLDTNTGIWIDIRNNVPDGYSTASRLLDTIGEWKRLDLIPSDTVVYGCPGSHKNRLKDHPNYMSIAEMKRVVYEEIDQRLKAEPVINMYHNLAPLFQSRDACLLKVDIQSKDRHYAVLKKLRDKWVKVKVTVKYQEFQSLKGLKGERATTQYHDKFVKKYPLSTHLYYADDEAIKHYVTLVSNCS